MRLSRRRHCVRQHDVDTARSQGLEFERGCGCVGHEGLDPVGRGDHGGGHGAELAAVRNDHQPLAALDRDPIDLRLVVVQVGNAPACGEASCAEDGEIEAIPLERGPRNGPDA